MPHPQLVLRMFKGATLEQKRALAKGITDAVVKTLKCPVDNVTIELEEYPKENAFEWETGIGIVKYGREK
jgi:4-oxalocrotonate tautomerase family enzyme